MTFATGSPVDHDRAVKQWTQYVETFAALGWKVHHVPPDDSLPDSVFIEDAIVMFDDFAVITNPGAPTRRAEAVGALETAAALGLEHVTITDGHLDGGDVLKVGRRAYVGRSMRTDDCAIDQLRSVLAPRGWTVLGVELTRTLHLKSAVTALPDGTIIGYDDLVDDPSVFPSYLSMPEEHGAHVVCLDDDTVLMSTAAPKSRLLLEGRGLRVVDVDISEFEKLDGCVTCLSVRVRC